MKEQVKYYRVLWYNHLMDEWQYIYIYIYIYMLQNVKMKDHGVLDIKQNTVIKL
jgi:hypothetical protein